MSEYEVVWSGASREPLPGIGGIERRGHYLDFHAPDQKRPPKAPGRRYARDRKRCACGRGISASDAYAGCTRCPVCRSQKRNLQRMQGTAS